MVLFFSEQLHYFAVLYLKNIQNMFPWITIHLRITHSLMIDKNPIFFSTKQKPSIFLVLILVCNSLQSLWNHRDISCEESAMPESCTLWENYGSWCWHESEMKSNRIFTAQPDLNIKCLNNISCFSSDASLNKEECGLKWV